MMLEPVFLIGGLVWLVGLIFLIWRRSKWRKYELNELIRPETIPDSKRSWRFVDQLIFIPQTLAPILLALAAITYIVLNNSVPLGTPTWLELADFPKYFLDEETLVFIPLNHTIALLFKIIVALTIVNYLFQLLMLEAIQHSFKSKRYIAAYVTYIQQTRKQRQSDRSLAWSNHFLWSVFITLVVASVAVLLKENLLGTLIFCAGIPVIYIYHRKEIHDKTALRKKSENYARERFDVDKAWATTNRRITSKAILPWLIGLPLLITLYNPFFAVSDNSVFFRDWFELHTKKYAWSEIQEVRASLHEQARQQKDLKSDNSDLEIILDLTPRNGPEMKVKFLPLEFAVPLRETLNRARQAGVAVVTARPDQEGMAALSKLDPRLAAILKEIFQISQ